MEVKEAPPSVKGNSVTGGTKVVTLENGSTINVPSSLKLVTAFVSILTQANTLNERK